MGEQIIPRAYDKGGDSSYKLPCDYVMLKYIVHIVPGCIYNT